MKSIFEKKDFFCAVCYYEQTCLTKSIFIWLIDDAEKALKSAEFHFQPLTNLKISRIEVYPKNHDQYAGQKPILFKNYF